MVCLGSNNFSLLSKLLLPGLLLYPNTEQNVASVAPLSRLALLQQERELIENRLAGQLALSHESVDRTLVKSEEQSIHPTIYPIQNSTYASFLNQTIFPHYTHQQGFSKDSSQEIPVKQNGNKKKNNRNTLPRSELIRVKQEEMKNEVETRNEETSMRSQELTQDHPKSLSLNLNANSSVFSAGEPALAELTQLFPEWDLGQIVAFLTNEDESVVKETQEELSSKRKEKELLEKDDNETNLRGQKIRKTRAWKSKVFQLAPGSQKKTTPLASKITYIKRLKQVTGLNEINEQKAHKLLTENFMDPKKAVLKVKRNFDFYVKYLKPENEFE